MTVTACLFYIIVASFTTRLRAQSTPTACQQQLTNQMDSLGQQAGASSAVQFIDPDTPDIACQMLLCQATYGQCTANQPPNDQLFLVFSDEFQKDYRTFGVGVGDSRWTAQDLYYFPTQDEEVYKPEQVVTYNGNAIITMEYAPGSSAKTLQPDGTIWDVPKNYKSGMVSSWNKFCYTGGYVEMRVKLPGDNQVPGFWPAFWTMGNLGRAGYMPSTQGLWPYSYSICGEGSSQATAIPGSKVPSQILSACPDNPASPYYINRTLYGMTPLVARNAPEFDVFEVIVGAPGAAAASQTLQMAPLLPVGESWVGLTPPGVQFPGQTTTFQTKLNPWMGDFQRPGNAYQDSMSALSNLNSSFYDSFHTFGVDWAPGEYMRWYIDGVFLYEINPDALVAQQGPGSAGQNITIGQRIIPVEPAYMIWNLGMSKDVGPLNVANLTFPAYMYVDYIRVYQRPKDINVGCSPPGYPTAQWISCHKKNYTTSSADDVLFGKCASASYVAQVAPSAILLLLLSMILFH